MIDKIKEITGVKGIPTETYTAIIFNSADFEKLKSLGVRFVPYKDNIMLNVIDDTITKILGGDYAI